MQRFPLSGTSPSCLSVAVLSSARTAKPDLDVAAYVLTHTVPYIHEVWQLGTTTTEGQSWITQTVPTMSRSKSRLCSLHNRGIPPCRIPKEETLSQPSFSRSQANFWHPRAYACSARLRHHHACACCSSGASAFGVAKRRTGFESFILAPPVRQILVTFLPMLAGKARNRAKRVLMVHPSSLQCRFTRSPEGTTKAVSCNLHARKQFS